MRHDDLKDDPEASLRRLCAFAGVPFGAAMQGAAADREKLSRYTLTPQKWRKNAAEIEKVLPATVALSTQLAALARA